MVWSYNEHEDFVPYYDLDKHKWAVSIQYLDVWYYKTQEEAYSDIPQLKKCRLKILDWVEEQNQRYYKRQAKEQEYFKKELYRAKHKEESLETRLCSDLTNAETVRLNSMLEAGWSDERIMETLRLSKRAVAQKRYKHTQRKENERLQRNLCKGTLA